MKLRITQFSPASYYFLTLRQNTFHSTTFSSTLSLLSSLNVADVRKFVGFIFVRGDCRYKKNSSIMNVIPGNFVAISQM